MIDRSLDKGLSDFFYVEKDETDLTYDYVGFMDKDGVILIAQFPKDKTSARYWVGIGIWATVWAAREDKKYVLPSQLKNPKIEK